MPQYIRILLKQLSSNTYLNNDDNEPMMMKDEPETLRPPEKQIVHYILMKEEGKKESGHIATPTPPSILEMK